MSSKFIVLAVIIFGALILLNYTGTLSLASGFTTLSLTQSQYSQSTDAILGEKPWILTFTAGGAGQYATGASATIDNQQIMSSNGSYAREDLSIKLTSQLQRCHYPILASASKPKIYTFGWKEYSIGIWPLSTLEQDMANAKADCAKFGTIHTVFKPGWSTKIICIYKNLNAAQVGNLPERPNVETIVDFEVSSQGQTYKQTLSNKNQTQVKFGDVAYANLVGGLQTYDQCPNVLQGETMVMYGDGYWRLIDSALYSQYESLYITSGSNVAWEANYDSAKILFDGLNARANAVLSSYKRLTSTQGGEAVIPRSDINNGEAVIVMANQIYVPQIVMYVKASWLGMVTPIPTPQITYISNVSFTTGQFPTLVVKVKNMGSQGGNINVALTCDSPVSAISGVTTISLQPNEEQQVSFALAGNTSTKASYKCTAVASTFGQQSTAISYGVISPAIVCTPNTRGCKGTNILEVCNFEGSYATQTQCPSGTSCGTNKYGEIDCIASPSPCRGEGQAVTPWLGEKCCENLVPNANNICTRVVTQCQDGTKSGECSKVSSGYRCGVNLLGQMELKQDVTCTAPSTCTQEFQKLETNGVCCANLSNTFGSCVPNWFNLLLVTGGGAIFIGGAYYLMYKKKGRR